MDDIRGRTFEFSRQILMLSNELKRRRDGVGDLTNQLLRSGTSVGANTEEAAAARSHAEFISTIGVARKEARETLYWLRLFDSVSAIPTHSSGLIRECNELVAILTAIVRNAESKQKKKFTRTPRAERKEERKSEPTPEN